MMILVGPVDWFVLKSLGRQPWTWVTTSGWIALLTLGAIYAGHVFKSGDLYFRSLQLIDQAGDRTVAVVDVIGIYSPRTSAYDLKTEADGWWQPLTTEAGYFRSNGMKTDIDFHQTWQGSVPEPLWINVWNLRFLRGDSTSAGPAMLSASLREAPSSSDVSRAHVVGVIHNLTDHPLTDLCVMTHLGDGDVKITSIASVPQTAPASQSGAGSIPPGATASIEAELTPPAQNPNEQF
jgi:hypothetical protein